MGIDIHALPLRVGLFGGEPSGEGMRDEIERRLGILATDNYGLSEVMGPGVSGECEHQCGLHMAEDHFLFEVVDPMTGEPRAEGEEGELIITSLTKEAFPVLRYRTHDLTVIDRAPCECGRTLARMRKVRAAHRRHAHHSRRERVPEPDRGRSAARSRASSRTTSSSSTVSARWTSSRSRSRSPRRCSPT